MSDTEPGLRTKAPLGGRFWAFWSASLASNTSDGVAMIAVPWLASSLTANPLLVTAVATAGRLPWLLALPAGALVDRVPRFTLMVCANAARALLWTLLAVAVVTGWISVPLLALFAFCFGALEVCHDTAAETTVPTLVPRPELERANGHLRSASLIAQEFGGRPIGGFLLAVGLFAPFVVNIAALLVSVGALSWVRARVPGTPGAQGQGRGPRGLFRDVAEGVRAVWEQPLLRLVTGIAIVVNASYATALSTQVLFVRDTLGLGSVGFGLLMAFAAVGGLAGSQSVAWLRRTLPAGTLPTVCLGMVGAVYLVVAAVPTVPVVAAGYFLASGLVIGYSVSLVSVRQRITPDRVLGRVNAAMNTVSWGVSAVGMALGGALVAALVPWSGQSDALRAPYALIGTVSVLVVLFLGRRLTRLVRTHDGPGLRC
ncbi:MFS transporter [Nocardiopsis sp. HNM0947]|uniref:MFS transporter n=1 Tax=Nocardiopsis coralli TaxID=2772213 RepID=A0ABR9P2C6_9ACTN|nr:MFS transporter [Nocardiopsis coralli]MBE2997993.1 MFS transporter [Nocardiopsis coralli]